MVSSDVEKLQLSGSNQAAVVEKIVKSFICCSKSNGEGWTDAQTKFAGKLQCGGGF